MAKRIEKFLRTLRLLKHLKENEHNLIKLGGVRVY